jgi:hypothetical protein
MTARGIMLPLSIPEISKHNAGVPSPFQPQLSTERELL